MYKTPHIDAINAYILRGACWFLFFVCALALFVVLDIWKHRNDARLRPSDAVAMVLLLVMSGWIMCTFARCAWTGRFPGVRQERPR